LKRMPASDCQSVGSGARRVRQHHGRSSGGASQDQTRTHPKPSAEYERDKDPLAKGELFERLIEAAERGRLPVVSVETAGPHVVAVAAGVLDRGVARAAVHDIAMRGDRVRLGVGRQPDNRPRVRVVTSGVDAGGSGAGPTEGRAEPGPEASRPDGTGSDAMAGLMGSADLVGGRRDERALGAHREDGRVDERGGDRRRDGKGES
jgi:hypothetical protein